jgi:hypothetical protein
MEMWFVLRYVVSVAAPYVNSAVVSASGGICVCWLGCVQVRIHSGLRHLSRVNRVSATIHKTDD